MQIVHSEGNAHSAGCVARESARGSLGSRRHRLSGNRLCSRALGVSGGSRPWIEGHSALWFGHGPRVCPGKYLGQLEVGLVVGAFVKLFRFKAVHDANEARAGVSTKPVDGVLMELELRQRTGAELRWPRRALYKMGECFNWGDRHYGSWLRDKVPRYACDCAKIGPQVANDLLVLFLDFSARHGPGVSGGFEC